MARRISDEELNIDVKVAGDQARKQMADLSDTNRQLAKENKTLLTQKKALAKAGKQQSDEYKALTTQIDKNKSSITANKNEQKELMQSIDLTQKSMSELKRESKFLQASMDGITDKSSKEFKDLQKELAAVNHEMFKVRKETNDIARAMGDTDDNASALTDAFGDLFGAISSGNPAAIKESLGAISSGIGGMTKASLAFIATPIGAAIAALVGIAVAAKMWFDYNEAAAEAYKTTQQITQLSGQTADEARIRAQAITDTFGGDFKENLETARSLVTQFGIDYSQAFDMIEDQLVRGQDKNDEFMDSINEYSTFFNGAGYSATQFGDIIATGYDLGFYNDKLPDALKEADLSLREQTTATRDAMLNAFGAPFTNDILTKVKNGEITTSQALQAISDEADKQGLSVQQAAQLTADLFRGAGEDAGGALKVFEAVNVALNDQKRELTENEKITQMQIDANKELERVMSGLFSNGEGGFSSLTDKAKLLWTQGLLRILKGSVSLINYFRQLNNDSAVFSGIITTIGEIAMAQFKIIGILIDNAGDAFSGLGDIISGVFTLDLDKITAGLATVMASNITVIDQVVKEAEGSAEKIKAAFSGENKLELLTLGSFTQESPTGDTPNPNTPTGGNTGAGSGAGDGNLTPKDQKILDSRKKLVELLDAFDKQQAIKEQTKNLEEAEAQKIKDELALEAKYLKLEEDALGEKELLKRLEEQKAIELQEIRDRYDAQQLVKDQALKDQLVAQELEAKERLTKAEQMYVDAQHNAANQGINILKNLVGQNSDAYKILSAIQAGAAISDILAKSSAAIAIAKSNEAMIPAVVPPGVPNLAKPLSVAATAKTIAATKLTAATQIASIAASTFQGFEDGYYPWTQTVTRDDGKRFGATYGGATKTGVVSRPTMFTDYLTGEGHRKELIVDSRTFSRLDPAVISHIQRAAHGIRGYETGMTGDVAGARFRESETTTTAQQEELLLTMENMNAMLMMLNARLSEPLKATTNIGYQEAQAINDLNNEASQSQNKARP